jgi:AmiR/NasT family two-component response regulator
VEELTLCRDGLHGKPEREVSSLAQVLAMVDDLFFQSKIIETARHVGVDLKICTTPDALAAEISKVIPNLVVVDLNARNQPIEAVQRTQSLAAGVPLVGFLSHVQTDLAEQAHAAGCREVMPRSKFTKDLATILARAKSETT